MINVERLRLLLEALRSGEFTQGQGALRRTQADGTFKHCCLGVAVEVAARNGCEFPVDPVHVVLEQYVDLPDRVMIWYGFSDTNPSLTTGVTAIRANDDLDWTFSRIADAIETRYMPKVDA